MIFWNKNHAKSYVDNDQQRKIQGEDTNHKSILGCMIPKYLPKE
jgi:hypothetical protein